MAYVYWIKRSEKEPDLHTVFSASYNF
jgi:hypothetical protein